jgi:uncharacterized protein YxeA
MTQTQVTENIKQSNIKPENRKINSFKSSGDVENLYRYVFNNNLRREARLILQEIHKTVIKAGKRRGRRLH